MKKLLALIFLASTPLLWARVTNQGATDRDAWCVGPSAKEVCVDKNGNMVPSTDDNQDLGTSALEFQDLYLDGTLTADDVVVDNSLTVGGSTLTISGGDVIVGGQLIVIGTETVRGNGFSVGGATFTVVEGRVGIRTVTPLYSFEVGGDAKITGQSIVAGTSTVQGTAFSVGGSTLAVTGGLVGIRTNNPQYVLDVGDGSVRFAGQLIVVGTTTLMGLVSGITGSSLTIVGETNLRGLVANTFTASSMTAIGGAAFKGTGSNTVQVTSTIYVNTAGINGGIDIGPSGNSAQIFYNTSGNLWISPRSGFNSVFTGGSVGVGVTSPNSALDILGPLNIRRSDDSAKISSITSEGNFILGAAPTFNMIFKTGGSGGTSERARIATTGEMTVSGGEMILGAADVASGHVNAFELMTFNVDTDNDDTNRYFAWFRNGSSGAGTEVMRLTEAGNLGIANASPANLLSLSSGAIQLGGSGAKIIYPDGTEQTTANVGSVSLTSTQTFSGSNTWTSSATFTKGRIEIGSPSADNRNGGVAAWMRSVDGAAQSSGCVVQLNMSGNLGDSFQTFTSTSTAADDPPVGVLLEDCAAGGLCLIGYSGNFRVQSTNSLALHSVVRASATRCKIDNATTRTGNGTTISTGDTSGWQWVHLR